MNPIDIQNVLERAKGSVRVGDHDEAERLLKSYIALKKDDRDAHLLLGTTLAEKGKYEEAADEFNTLLMKNPLDIEALNNIAVMFRRQGKYQQALNTLIEAIDIDPTRPEFHYNIGNVHKQMGNFKAASMAYAKVIELDPTYVSAYNNLGTIFDELNEYDKALNIFAKGMALDHNNPTLHYNYGLALEVKGRLDEAAEQYRLSLKSRPGWPPPMNTLGTVFFKQGRHYKALDIYKRLLETHPGNAEAWNNIGIVQAALSKKNEAINSHRKALELNPEYAKAAVNLERILEDSGRMDEAVEVLENLLKKSPDLAEARNRLARLYLKNERFQEALEQADISLQKNGNDIQALRISGAAQRMNGKDEEARAAFEKILSLDPGNYAFHLDLADIHFRRKEYKEAEKSLLAFLDERPNDRNAKLLLGRLYAEMAENEKAIDIFEELSKTDPHDTEALSAAAEIHQAAGSLEKALQTADTLVNVQGKRASSEDLSELNRSLEFYENAVDAYSSSVREMWDRNIQLINSEEMEEEEIDLSMFLDFPRIFQDDEDEDQFLRKDESPLAELKKEEKPQDIPAFKFPLAFQALKEPVESGAGEAPAYPKEMPPSPGGAPAYPGGAPPSPGGTPVYPGGAPVSPGAAPVYIPVVTPVYMPQNYTPPAPEIRMPVQEPPALHTQNYPEPVPKTEPEKILPIKPPLNSAKPPSPVFLKPVLLEQTSTIILDTLGLMNYLKSQVNYVPEKEKAEFMQSNVRLSLERVIGILEGSSGRINEG